MVSNLKNNRLVYFAYFIHRAKWPLLRQNFRHTSACGSRKGLRLIIDVIINSIRRGFSFDEYFYYGFANRNPEQRRAYASIVDMYKFQLAHNPRASRAMLEDKIQFLSKTTAPIGRHWLDLTKATDADIVRFVSGKEKVVLKRSRAGAGKAVRVISFPPTKHGDVPDIAREGGFDLLEEYVYQHPRMNALHPASLNTVRVVTQVTSDGDVDVLGCILRMGVGINTDNLSTGGIACPIDSTTGRVTGPGICFDIAKGEFEMHPTSGVALVGLEIPHWERIMKMCREAAAEFLPNRSVGWDVAVTEAGPVLIEGNHDWGARLLQMPHKRGIARILERYTS